MPGLRDLQHEFLNYLLEKPSSIVNTIMTTGNVTSHQRLNLYADGYKLRLKEAITTDYEQLHAYLGDDNFDQLMNEYINLYPSHHPSLRYYSKHIPELLSAQQPWLQASELAELAVIEKSFCDSFDAADCKPVTLNDLTRLEPEKWPTLRIIFNDSVQLLNMNFNSFQIWKALSEGINPPKLIQESSKWLIWRSQLMTKYHAVSDAEAIAVQAIMNGGDFSDLCESLLDYFDEQEVPQQTITMLHGWISNRMVCQLK